MLGGAHTSVIKRLPGGDAQHVHDLLEFVAIGAHVVEDVVRSSPVRTLFVIPRYFFGFKFVCLLALAGRLPGVAAFSRVE